MKINLYNLKILFLAFTLSPTFLSYGMLRDILFSSSEFVKLTEEKLLDAIEEGDIDKVKKLIDTGLDLNQRIWSEGHTFLAESITEAIIEPSEDRLQIIEMLIQAGAKIHEAVQFYNDKWSALRYAMVLAEPNLTIIRLLLGYGAKITDEILKEVTEKENAAELEKIFSHHIALENQAKNDPTRKLLIEVIGYNKPYIVELITRIKPELVESEDIKFAEKTSPFSVRFLNEALSSMEEATNIAAQRLARRLGRQG